MGICRAEELQVKEITRRHYIHASGKYNGVPKHINVYLSRYVDEALRPQVKALIVNAALRGWFPYKIARSLIRALGLREA